MDTIRRSRLFAIPDRLNIALVLIADATLAGALIWGARAHDRWQLAAAVAIFALAFQTNFALLHEAAHGKLHSRRRTNALLGTACAVWFPMSWSMFATTHTAHHLKNRTDEEMFELYYDSDSKARKCALWYAGLAGFWYWMTPLGNALLVVAPRTYKRVADRWRLTQSVFAGGPKLIARVRLELLAAIAFLGGVAFATGIAPLRLLLFYAAAGWLWSTTQYLEHAYAPRLVVDGAFNLRAPAAYSWLNLHRELDLNHHRYPHEAWLHLPRFSPAHEVRRSYFRHYLAQWRGPRRATEPAPAALPAEDLM
jgi:fatty acid desaturase